MPRHIARLTLRDHVGKKIQVWEIPYIPHKWGIEELARLLDILIAPLAERWKD